jgi:uncharacterized protein involved in copper resistance
VQGWCDARDTFPFAADSFVHAAPPLLLTSTIQYIEKMDHSHMDHGHMDHDMPGMDHGHKCNMNVCYTGGLGHSGATS